MRREIRQDTEDVGARVDHEVDAPKLALKIEIAAFGEGSRGDGKTP